ncbi:tRNA pseudouridine(55) synthase TruB [Candidatus Nomurabacteria bacterium]|nr:tRNA pseudouridine(55) synthase TruB [Candidatus Nomurabacteria bacterium]
MNLTPVLQPYMIEPDILLVDKPSGISSFDVIRILRRNLGIRKMGHAGTLDPLASGLMIVGIQTGTKKLTHYLKLPKEYIATIQLGSATTSGDTEGETICILDNFDIPTEKQIQEVLTSLLGEHDIVPPVYSAIKVDGRPLYWYARKNTCPIFMPTKHMGVTDIEFLSLQNDQQGVWKISCRIAVTSGTYIRSLAELVGQGLGIPATLSALRRVRIESWDVRNAFDIKNMI